MFKTIFTEFIKTMSTRFIVSVIASGVATYAVIDHQTSRVEDNNDDEKITKNEVKISKQTRTPASITSKKNMNSLPAKSKAQFTSYDQSNFNASDSSEKSNDQNSGGVNATSSSYKNFSPKTPSSPPPLAKQEIEHKASNQNEPKQSALNSNTVAIAPPIVKELLIEKKVDAPVAKIIPPVENTPSTGSANLMPNTCSPSIQAGSFGNPIGITLVCTYPSTIKYCLSTSATCCDPESGGLTYKSKIIVGPKDGNYCLSYVGDSDLAGNSSVYTQTYTINSTFPNLSVGHPQIFYQTTELTGKSFISSTDFGKTNFKIGQINLKTHDPGVSGLNYSCDDIMADYSTLLTPSATEMLSLFDVSLAPHNSQVEIPLQLNQLNYGDNFITSYIENNNFVVPIYSCSTAKINLDDFEYFQADIAQGEIGNNSQREFEGQLSSYGFFETDQLLASGQIGLSAEEKTGEILKSGIFSMLY